jgi:hypothetical protein
MPSSGAASGKAVGLSPGLCFAALIFFGYYLFAPGASATAYHSCSERLAAEAGPPKPVPTLAVEQEAASIEPAAPLRRIRSRCPLNQRRK